MNKQRAGSRCSGIALVIAGVIGLLTTHSPQGYAAQGEPPTAYPPVHVPMEVQRVPDSNAYYVLGQPAVPDQENEGFTSNAGFVITDAGVVVYDALGTPSLGFALIQEIRALTDQPIKYVIAGHYHADHVYGLQAFKDYTDAVVIAQQKAYLYIHSEDADERLAQRRVALAPWVNARTRVVEPDITFTDELTLNLGDVSFKLVYAGPAHAPDDILMMVEPAGILFAGDIVQNHRIPSLYSSEVNTQNWLDGLATVRKLNPQFIIPGHGQPSTNAIAAIDFTQTYIRYVRQQMQEAVASWTDFSRAYSETDWSRYAGLPAFDATNKRNAYHVYLDMEDALLD